MSNNCGCTRDCVFWSLIVSLAVGVLVAFLTVTAVIVLAPIASVVALGYAAVYLALLTIFRRRGGCCRALFAVIIGLLVTILAALVLIAFTFAATSVVGAIVTGVLAAAVTLTLTTSGCYLRCDADCID